MKDIREATRNIISKRILPWIERDGISKLLLPEQITPTYCIRSEKCKRRGPPPNREPSLAIGLTGKAPYCIDRKAFVFTPGAMVLLPGETVQMSVQMNWWRATDIDPDWSPSILWLMVYPFGVQVQVLHIMDEVDAVEATRPHMLLGQHFSVLMGWLMEEVRFKPLNCARIGRHILLEFMERCLRAATAVDVMTVSPHRRTTSGQARRPRRRKRDKPTEVAPDQLPRRVRAARDFIHSNYYRPLSLDDIADAAEASVTHLSRQFKAALGTTPIQYLTNIRMEAASELLLTDLKILRVAQLVGIGDAHYFSRLFRRINGLTPRQYCRRMVKAAERQFKTKPPKVR